MSLDPGVEAFPTEISNEEIAPPPSPPESPVKTESVKPEATLDGMVPVTPTKNNSGKTPRKATGKKRKIDESGVPSPSPQKRSKATPGKKSKDEAYDKLPTRPQELKGEDYDIWFEKVENGKSWAEITTYLSKKYNKSYGASTARMRWNRFIEPNMATVKDEHRQMLKDAVFAAQERIEKTVKDLESEIKAARDKRWTTVAEIMAEQGAEHYPAKTLERVYQQIKDVPITEDQTEGEVNDTAPVDVERADSVIDSAA